MGKPTAPVLAGRSQEILTVLSVKELVVRRLRAFVGTTAALMVNVGE